VIKMTAVIVLAVFSVRAVGGMDALKRGLTAHFGSETAALSVLPVSLSNGGVAAYAWMPAMTIAVFLFVQWWAAWYPGAEPGGGGYVAQRIFSARTERDGVLATLFFQVAHYAMRPWPWIITGLATVLLYPQGVMVNGVRDHEAAYVQAFVDLLPTGWRGFMLAGFAAAYMSTVATQLNWGASYLVNDFYRRFMRKTATEKHYVSVSRWATIGLFLLSILVTSQLATVEQAWKFLIGLGAGTGLVYILRWYWWRINAWSEISAMIASFVTFSYVSGAFGLVLSKLHIISADRVASFTPSVVANAGADADAVTLLITVIVTTVVWVVTTLVTQPEAPEVLESFYERVRPGGRGWLTVSTRLGYGREQIPGGSLAWTYWLAGIVAVYSALFGVGKIIFGEFGVGIVMLVIAALAFAWIARSFRSEQPPPALVRQEGKAREAVAAD
jgi:Na+/proline symporter